MKRFYNADWKKLPSLVYIIGKLKCYDLLWGFNSEKFPSANIDFFVTSYCPALEVNINRACSHARSTAAA